MLRICTFIYVLQITLELSKSQTNVHSLSYWKTTDITDNVPDYWNHGPIVFPEQRDVSKTKNHDIATQISTESLIKTATESNNLKVMMNAETTVDSVNTTQKNQTVTKIAGTPPIIMIRSSNVTKSMPAATENTRNSMTLKPVSKKDDVAVVAEITPHYNSKFKKISTQTTLVIQTTTRAKISSTEEVNKKNTSVAGDVTGVAELEFSEPQSTTTAQMSSTNEEYNKERVPDNYDATKSVTDLETLRALKTNSTVTTITATIATYNDLRQTTDDEALEQTTRDDDDLKLTTVQPELRAIDKIGPTTEPFSVFLGNFFKVLSEKNLADLPLLIEQFKTYVSMLLTNGQLSRAGVELNSIIAKTILLLDHLTTDQMRDYFDVIQKTLAVRKTSLSKLFNDLLDYMDDLYDEEEEEAMQAVLMEVTRYPNTNNNNKIAQGFVDYVFLKPMLRVAGTSKGKILFQMIVSAVEKRNELYNTDDKDLQVSNSVNEQANFSKTVKDFILAVIKNKEKDDDEIIKFHKNSDFRKHGKKVHDIAEISSKGAKNTLKRTHKGKVLNRNYLNSKSHKMVNAYWNQEYKDETNTNIENIYKPVRQMKPKTKYTDTNKQTGVYKSIKNIEKKINIVLDKLERVLTFLEEKKSLIQSERH